MNCWAGTAPSPNRADSVSRWAAEKFVTIRNGIPILASRASASAAPGSSSPLKTITPSASRTNPRTPASAFERSVIASC